MADSYPTADVGLEADFPRFPFHPNWTSPPTTKVDLVRTLIAMRGAAHAIRSVSDDAPISFEAKYTLFTRADYNTLLDFFVDARGKVNRFWVWHPHRSFKLKTNAGNGDGEIYCYPNFFQKQYQGYERIYITMTDGDVVARHVTDATYNESEDRLELSLNTALDRDITTTNHRIIGRYLLVRFDTDEIEFSIETDTVCETSLAFRELVKEYSEI